MAESNVPEIKNTIKINIEDEIRGAYLDYAMSVIIGRALPDVRDGLKPVHRRVLYAMYDLGNNYNKAYKKSARVVGDVIGKYHPHGDKAVYDTIVRMAQDFSLRYPLVDGQGNFGSIDGDSAAAMRYTEIRMEKLSDELLADLDKETVDFGPNYDDSLKEPLVMPSRFPNLLVNGASGIAVGMATNIPPHNMSEVVDAALALIKDQKLTTQDLMKIVKGPDFPTRGLIVGTSGIQKAYLTGRGSVTMRGRAEIETLKGDRERIIITELPYQVNKAKLIERVAELVRDKKIEGISDIRDESNREGIRVVVDVKKSEQANILLNNLFNMTQLQENFSISMLAIHNNQPKVFNLRDMIWAFVEHRKDVVLRRTAFELRKAEARAHILLGLKTAVENLDAVIKLIKDSENPDVARSGLMSKYSMSELQAQAVLDMRLHRLTGLERDKIIAEYNEILQLITRLKEILMSEKLVMEIIEKELREVREQYGDERRTEITVVTDGETDFDLEDLIPNEETLVTLTHRGYIKRMDPNQFRSQKRGGKGMHGVTTTEDDFVSALYQTKTLSTLMCFTDKGRMYAVKVFKLPEATRQGKGKGIANLINLHSSETVKAVLPVNEFSEKEFVVFGTKNGVVKRVVLSEFKNLRAAGVIAIGIEDGDELVGAKLSNGAGEVILCSHHGKMIRFPEDKVRAMGRTAFGVAGMDLEKGDHIVSIDVVTKEAAQENSGYEILTVSEFGYGRRTPVSEYRLTSRGGKGVINMKIGDRGMVVGARLVHIKEDVMLVTNKGQMIRTTVGEISEQSRYGSGVTLMDVAEGEKVVAVEHMPHHEEDESEGNESGGGSTPDAS